jgi:hypothetical protein
LPRQTRSGDHLVDVPTGYSATYFLAVDANAVTDQATGRRFEYGCRRGFVLDAANLSDEGVDEPEEIV